MFCQPLILFWRITNFLLRSFPQRSADVWHNKFSNYSAVAILQQDTSRAVPPCIETLCVSPCFICRPAKLGFPAAAAACFSLSLVCIQLLGFFVLAASKQSRLPWTMHKVTSVCATSLPPTRLGIRLYCSRVTYCKKCLHKTHLMKLIWTCVKKCCNPTHETAKTAWGPKVLGQKLIIHSVCSFICVCVNLKPNEKQTCKCAPVLEVFYVKPIDLSQSDGPDQINHSASVNFISIPLHCECKKQTFSLTPAQIVGLSCDELTPQHSHQCFIRANHVRRIK